MLAVARAALIELPELLSWEAAYVSERGISWAERAEAVRRRMRQPGVAPTMADRLLLVEAMAELEADHASAKVEAPYGLNPAAGA